MKNQLEFLEQSERWCSLNEVTEHLGCSRDTLCFWIKNKGLPAVKIGRTWRLKLSEVDDWLNSFRINDNANHK